MLAAGCDLQTTRDLWEETKHRELWEQLVRFASEVNRSGPSLDIYGKFKNEAIRFGSAVMVAGKRWVIAIASKISTHGGEEILSSWKSED